MPGRASWRARCRRRRRRSAPRSPRRRRARAPRGPTPRPTSRRRRASSPPRAPPRRCARRPGGRAAGRRARSPCRSRSCACAARRSAPRSASGSSNSDAIRSLPPPILSRSPYSSSDHATGRPASANAWLNAGRWPSRSVSARTPSQSKISAGTLLRRPRSRTPGPAPPSRRCGCGARPSSFTAARTWRRSDGGSCLPGFASRYSRCASTNAIFSAVEMLTFAHPRAMRSANCASVRPVPPCSTIGIGCSRDDLRDALGHQVRLGLVEPVRGPDRRRERVDAGRRDELARHLDRVHLAAVVGADAVLDAGDALDLALDLRAVAVGLGDDLDRLARVLGDVELGAVEQHRVPARLEAGRDPLPVGAVVEVERHRDRAPRRPARATSRRTAARRATSPSSARSGRSAAPRARSRRPAPPRASGRRRR